MTMKLASFAQVLVPQPVVLLILRWVIVPPRAARTPKPPPLAQVPRVLVVADVVVAARVVAVLRELHRRGRRPRQPVRVARRRSGAVIRAALRLDDAPVRAGRRARRRLARPGTLVERVRVGVLHHVVAAVGAGLRAETRRRGCFDRRVAGRIGHDGHVSRRRVGVAAIAGDVGRAPARKEQSGQRREMYRPHASILPRNC